jgi:hypothetical protein
VATAGLANEFRLQIGQSNLVAPFGGVDHDGMRAFEVAAVDDEPARAVAWPHFPESDFLFVSRTKINAYIIKLAACAGPWDGSRMSQALDGRPFQAPFQKSALKVWEIGFEQASVSADVTVMGPQAGEFLVGHGASVWMKEIYSGEQITVALAFNGFVISKLRAGAFDCPQNQSRFTLVVGSQ